MRVSDFSHLWTLSVLHGWGLGNPLPAGVLPSESTVVHLRIALGDDGASQLIVTVADMGGYLHSCEQGLTLLATDPLVHGV